MSGTVELKIRLEAEITRQGEDWVASCLPLDLFTQAESKDLALEALHEAVSAWFESCLERRVLAKALEEVGFKLAKPGDPFPSDLSSVEAGKPHTSHEFLEVSVPAYIAAEQLDSSAYASH